MKYYIGCEAHNKYLVFTIIDEKGKFSLTRRVGTTVLIPVMFGDMNAFPDLKNDIANN